jgi:mRNA-degrading endonuclease RelE of RelBE toxin-antitoxin system
MSYKVRTIPNFDKALKRLAKKYPSLKVEFVALLDSLEKEPEQGTSHQELLIFIKYCKQKSYNVYC